MTREEVIAHMLQYCDLHENGRDLIIDLKTLECIIDFVSAHEREACAKLCQDYAKQALEHLHKGGRP